MVRVPDAKSDCSCRGEAEVHIINFKTTWSEFQKASPTAAERGEAELRILDFKTTWSEFQKPSQTAAKQGKAELRTLDFKTTFRNSNRQLLPTKFHHLSNAILGPSSCVCQLI